MEILEAVKNRRSIRSFLQDPVQERTIREIISESLWAPSWGNTQPWEIVIAAGLKLESFKQENRKAFFAGREPCPDVPMPWEWPDMHMDRYKGVGRKVLAALKVDRDDHARRSEYYGRMFSLFDAPVLLLITVDRALSLEYACLDTGIFIQTVCLLAYEKGLGTCVMAAAVYYPELLREYFLIPEEKAIVMGVVLGWPDTDDPVNRFERDRADIAEAVRYVTDD